MADGSSQYEEMPQRMTVKISVPQIKNDAQAIYDSSSDNHLQNRIRHPFEKRTSSCEHTPAH